MKTHEIEKIEIVRDRISISSIDAAFMLKAQIGFIKISKFGANTDEDFIAELSKLLKGGMKCLILVILKFLKVVC